MYVCGCVWAVACVVACACVCSCMYVCLHAHVYGRKYICLCLSVYEFIHTLYVNVYWAVLWSDLVYQSHTTM